MLLRFRQDVIELRPSIVVILAGINDIAQNTGPSTVEMIANNIFSMAELAKVNNIEVLLCSVLPAEKFSWSANIEPTKIVIELNEKIRNYAIKNQITYVNYFDEMKNKSNGMKKELAEDGIHPNSKGYKVMEEILNLELLQSLNR
jgi:lysophospholipase L1-like esterase